MANILVGCPWREKYLIDDKLCCQALFDHHAGPRVGMVLALYFSDAQTDEGRV